MQFAQVVTVAAVVCCTQGVSSSPAEAQMKASAGTGVSPEADHLLRGMSASLGEQKAFTVKFDGKTDAILNSGQKVQVQSTGMVYVKRPGEKLRVDKRGDDGNAQAFSDGKTFTFYSVPQNGYVSTPASATLDATLERAQTSGKAEVEMPGADLLYSDPYTGLMEDVVSGESLGTSVVQGVPTHHLAFRGREVDWQIWIEDGPRQLPRKYVITSKKIEGSPEYEVLLSDWNLEPKFADNVFEFRPPPGAAPIRATEPAKAPMPH
jgi:hypothetical protein